MTGKRRRASDSLLLALCALSAACTAYIDGKNGQGGRAFRDTGFNFGKTWLGLVRSDAFRHRRLP